MYVRPIKIESGQSDTVEHCATPEFTELYVSSFDVNERLVS